MRVIISCSGKFHAFALAEQLEKHGVLDTLYTSYSSITNPLAKYLVSRRDKEQIPKSKIKTCLPIAFGLKLINKPFFWNDLFDKWVAFKIKRSQADVFIGWSGMSLRTIQAAKKKGMITILERGSSHIVYQDELLREEFKKFNLSFEIDPNILVKEMSEYEEANFISVPSKFALNSFREKGISLQKIFINNYGTSQYFKSKGETLNRDKFRILYLGTLGIQKGSIYLFEALSLINIPANMLEVWFIGSILPEIQLCFDEYKNISWNYLGFINHYQLSEYLNKCDVAIQPSLQEGLSMVIPQILSCGVPVIASTNSGGEDIIKDGVTGFIVPIRDSHAIKQKIELLYEDRALLKQMKNNCINQKLDLSWDAYGDRYFKNLEKYVLERA